MRIVTSRCVVALSLAFIASTVTGCAPASRSGLDDAQLTMRVKTALLNDPDLGTQPITVDVSGGVVHLSGRVADPEQIAQAERVVRAVNGVRGVQSTLEVWPREFVSRERPGRLPSIPGPDPGGPAGIIAIGAAGTFGLTPEARLGNGVGYGLIIRLRPRRSWGPTFGFSWTRTRLDSSPAGQPGLADFNVRPLMGGVEYGFTRGRLASGVSLVGQVRRRLADRDLVGTEAREVRSALRSERQPTL